MEPSPELRILRLRNSARVIPIVGCEPSAQFTVFAGRKKTSLATNSAITNTNAEIPTVATIFAFLVIYSLGKVGIAFSSAANASGRALRYQTSRELQIVLTVIGKQDVSGLQNATQRRRVAEYQSGCVALHHLCSTTLTKNYLVFPTSCSTNVGFVQPLQDQNISR